MDSVEASTVIYLPPEDVYEFLIDFPRYADYSTYLREVRRRGDGGPGTVYDITVTWWKITYTARSRVTDIDPPHRIDWEIVKDVDARGYWQIDATDPPDDHEEASEVRLHITFDPESADEHTLDLPTFVTLDRVIDAVTPKVEQEAERVVRRIVADLEGEPRDVGVTVHTAPDPV